MKDSIFDLLFSFVEGTTIRTIINFIVQLFALLGTIGIALNVMFRVRRYWVKRKFKRIKKTYMNAEIIEVEELDSDSTNNRELHQSVQKIPLLSFLTKTLHPLMYFVKFGANTDSKEKLFNRLTNLEKKYVLLHVSGEDGVTRTLKLDEDSTDGSNVKRGKLRVGIKGALGIKDDGKDNQMVVDFLPGFDADTGQVVDNNQK